MYNLIVNLNFSVQFEIDKKGTKKKIGMLKKNNITLFHVLLHRYNQMLIPGFKKHMGF